MGCPGLHCDGCGDSGGPVIGAVILLFIIAFVASKGRAIEHGADDVIHVLIIVAIVTAGIAIAGIGTYVYTMHRMDRKRRHAAIQVRSIALHPPVNRPNRSAINPPPATIHYLNEMWQHSTGDSE